MNQKKKQAHGFKLSPLIKNQLSRSRSVEFSHEFLLNDTKYKVHLDFVKDLGCLNEACSIDLPQLRPNMAQVGPKINQIKKELNLVVHIQKR